MIRFSPWKRAAVLFCAVALVSACGASPTDTPAASPGAGADGASALEAVYAAVEGKTGQERFDILLEMAKQEESENGPIQLYHFGDFPDEIEAFQEDTGLGLEPFNSTAERVAERVNNEFRAGQVASSVTMTSFDAMAQLYTDGAIAELESPFFDEVGDAFKGEAWLSPLGIMIVPGYNTDGVPADQLPQTWEDFFTNYDGRIAVELTGWKWLGSLVQSYFEEQKGMTEEDAIALITEGLRGSFVVDGNTLMANLLASGQYDFVPAVYAHHIARLQGEGAPVTWEGIPEGMPPVFTTTGMALSANAPNPAGGLLFIEYMLSDRVQQIIADRNYVPSITDFPGHTLLDDFPNAIPQQIDPVGDETPAEVVARWTGLWETLLREAGTELVEETG